MQETSPPPGTVGIPASEPSYQRGLLLIALLAAGLLGALALWAHNSWDTRVANAQTDLQRLAAVNTLPVALSVRDGRRAAEAMDSALSAMGKNLARNDADVLRTMMATELALRFNGDEVADLFQPGRDGMLATTARDSFDPTTWAQQLQRVGTTRSATLGWAYQRGGSWWLPLFYVRDTGQVLVINLPVNAIFGHWLDSGLPGENPAGLRSADDRVLLRRPFTPPMLGADARGAASSRLIDHQRSLGAESGAVRAIATETDSVERLIGWAVVPGTDLRTLVAANTDNLRAQWRGDTAPKFAAMAVLTTLALGGAALALRRLHRHAGGERRALADAEHARAMTQSALWGSRDMTWRLPLSSGDMHFEGDLAQLLGAPAATDVARQDTLAWLLMAVDAPSRAQLLHAVADARAHADSLHVRLAAAGVDGSTRHLVLRGRKLAPMAGQPAMMAGTLRDVTQQAHAQAQLAQQEAILQRMCSLARIGPWSVDPASAVLTLSPIARELYGRAAHDALPLWHDFHPADSKTRERVQTARNRLLRDGVGYDLVLPADLTDGSRRWLRSVAAAHYTEGVLDRIDGAVQDVTAQVEAQEALARQSTHSRLLIEAVATSSQLLLVTDPQQRITWCNDAFIKRTGYALEEVRGQRPSDVLQRGTVPQAIRALMQRHITAREAFRGVRVQNFSKDGTPYWVDLEVRPVFDDQGELECFIALQTDVTHDIEREHALRESAHRFELATAHAGMGVYDLDIERNTRTWSEGMYRLFGFDAAQGLPSLDEVDARVLPEDRHARRPSLLAACADRTRHEWTGEFRVRRPDGSLAWLQSCCQIQRDDQGRALRAVGTTLDITSERAVAQERQARAEAEARSHAKTAFLSRMSHELRTPLHAVIGYSQLINAAKGSLPGVAAPYMERIELAGWHLLALIDDVLELGHLDSVDVPIAREAVSLDAVAREAHAFIEHEAEKAGLRFDVSLQPVAAWANATRVRQVVVNLLSNAVKYTLAAGTVRLEVRTEGSDACLEVSDTGMGMSEAQLANLYEPFNRLGREDSGVEGTGLGLAITKRLVDRMGGTLEVSSRVDRGSTFTLRLPLAASSQLASPEQPPVPAAAVQSRRLEVVCVEDNEVNALLLVETLQHLRPGCTVRVAGTGLAATQLLREAPAHLVFLDLNLPDTQGLEWLDCARRAGLVAQAEVVLLTADVMPQTRAAAQAAGLRHFLPKPLPMTELTRLLDELVVHGPPGHPQLLS